jgi:ectoine hydroxylase-related dioxygenase (phytanoyl-CoA dioxygenase family)
MKLSSPPELDDSLTDEQRSLLPTEADVRFYREHGYYISRKILSDDEIDRALEAGQRLYRGERDVPDSSLPEYLQHYFENKTKTYASAGLRKTDHSSFAMHDLARLAKHRLVGAIASRLSGSRTIRLWHDQLLYKPVNTGSAPANVGWHVDRGYWKTCSSDMMITAWIPFHDCDAAMGTITMIDGSNRWPDNSENLDFYSHDLDGLEKTFRSDGKEVVKVPVNLKKGQVSFHGCLTIHGSGPNRGAMPRQSIAVHLQDETNRYRACKRRSGEDVWHANDKMCQKTADGVPDYTDPDICPVIYQER